MSVETTTVPNKTKRLLVTLPSTTWDILEHFTKVSGCTKSRIITDAIYYFVTKMYSNADKLRKGRELETPEQGLDDIVGALELRRDMEGKR